MGTPVAWCTQMASKNPQPMTRQVTVQPQERSPEAGRPHVPHTRVKQPGQAAPLPEDNDPEDSDDAVKEEDARRP
jgi:hypothetical protein